MWFPLKVKKSKHFLLKVTLLMCYNIWVLEFQLAAGMTTGERFCISNQKPKQCLCENLLGDIGISLLYRPKWY